MSQHAALVEPQEQELEKGFVEIEDIEHNVDKQHYNSAKSDNANNSIKDTTHERTMVDVSIQFPLDTAQEILSKHSYSLKCTEEPSVNTSNNSDFQAHFLLDEYPHSTAEAAESST